MIEAHGVKKRMMAKWIPESQWPIYVQGPGLGLGSRRETCKQSNNEWELDNRVSVPRGCILGKDINTCRERSPRDEEIGWGWRSLFSRPRELQQRAERDCGSGPHTLLGSSQRKELVTKEKKRLQSQSNSWYVMTSSQIIWIWEKLKGKLSPTYLVIKGMWILLFLLIFFIVQIRKSESLNLN